MSFFVFLFGDYSGNRRGFHPSSLARLHSGNSWHSLVRNDWSRREIVAAMSELNSSTQDNCAFVGRSVVAYSTQPGEPTNIQALIPGCIRRETSMETVTNTLANAPTLVERAYNIRRKAVCMGEIQGQGYIAQALGISDVLAVAYFHAMRYRPEDPDWEDRDRFLLSNGHYAIALYAALIEAGIIPDAELESYGSDESRLPMSGMASYTPGMEMSGGSLGLG